MDTKKIFTTKFTYVLVAGLIILMMLLFALRLGMMIGEHKASFSQHWNDNYQRNFAGPRGGFGPAGGV